VKSAAPSVTAAGSGWPVACTTTRQGCSTVVGRDAYSMNE
jgi:hypothetical protein